MARALTHDAAFLTRCVFADSGAQAVSTFATTSPDAVVVATCLSDMDGYTLLASLEHRYGAVAGVVVGVCADHKPTIQHDGTHEYLLSNRASGSAVRSAVRSVVEKQALAQQVRAMQEQLSSQRNTCESALKRCELALDGMSEGFFALDTRWRFTTLNRRAEHLFGRSRTELIGAGIWDTFPPQTSHGVFAVYREWFERAVAQQCPMRFDVYLPWSPGWYEMRVIPSSDGIAVYAQDITYQKSIVASVQGYDPQIRRLVDANIVGIMTGDMEGRIIEANDMVLNLVGYTREELEADELRWTALTPSGFAARDAKALEELARTGIAHPYEKAYIHRDGHQIPVVIGAAVLDHDMGTLIAFILDISERKHAENALRRRQREFSTLVENLPDIIARFDRELRHQFVSPAVERVTGRPHAYFLGKTIADLGMPPEISNMWNAHLAQCFEQDAEATFEFSMHTSSGNRYYRASVVPEHGETGSVETVLVIARDITAQKRSENNLRFLDLVSTTLGATLDYEETVQQVAQLAVTKLGDHCIVHLRAADGSLQRSAEQRGEVSNDHEWLDDYIASKSEAAFGPAAVMRTGKSELIADTATFRSPDEDVPLAMLHAAGVRSMLTVPMKIGTRLLGTISFATTVSERHFDATDLLLAEEVAHRAATAIDNARLYHTAYEAVRERDAFLSIAAHEVKNPLTTVLGHAQLIERRDTMQVQDKERDRHDIQMILDQTRRATTLLNDMTDASLFETGKHSFFYEPIDLRSLLLRVITKLRSVWPAFNFEISASNEPLIVSGDGARLEQVFHNLISNAVKYSPDGDTVKINITTSNRMACVAIHDQGIGIPDAAIPRLFKRFFRVRNEQTEDIPGSGLGLYVVKEIVAQHGGTIEVESVEGQGSTFSVELPLFDADQSAFPSSPSVASS